MKLIVISGSHSSTGKTTLARKISDSLKDSPHAVIKIGHEQSKPDKPGHYFTSMDDALRCVDNYYLENKLEYLIVESNSIISHRTPDILLFIKGSVEQKPSAFLCETQAHLSTSKVYSDEEINNILLHTIGSGVIFAALDIFRGDHE